tara:strand:+ start:235 stop:555 length:321 start_codon:yes stop_codon:yes gene_type:complete
LKNPKHFTLKTELSIDNQLAIGRYVSEKRILRKMKKLASRIQDKMEIVTETMEDLEIEFEILQKQITKLEAKKGLVGQDVDDLDDKEDEEIIDIENTSSVTIKQKF